MSIDDELNDHLSALASSAEEPAVTEAEGDLLVREITDVCAQVARALRDRGIPVVPIMVRTSQKSSHLKYFFKGDESNILMKAADGWEFWRCIRLDTNGTLWVEGNDHWKQLDVDRWRHVFSKPEGFVFVSPLYVHRRHDDEGKARLELTRPDPNGVGNNPTIVEPLRDALLREAATIIMSQH